MSAFQRMAAALQEGEDNSRLASVSSPFELTTLSPFQLMASVMSGVAPVEAIGSKSVSHGPVVGSKSVSRDAPVESMGSGDCEVEHHSGFHTDLFVDEKAIQNYLCAICQQVCEDPTETNQAIDPCGHIFCQTCIIQSLSYSGKHNQTPCCPTCKRELSPATLRRCPRAEREIAGLKVRHAGCPTRWVGDFGVNGVLYDQHVGQCSPNQLRRARCTGTDNADKLRYVRYAILHGPAVASRELVPFRAVSTIRYWLAEHGKGGCCSLFLPGRQRKPGGGRKTALGDHEQTLYNWFVGQRREKHHVTQRMIRLQAVRLADQHLGHGHGFCGTHTWYKRFATWYNLLDRAPRFITRASTRSGSDTRSETQKLQEFIDEVRFMLHTNGLTASDLICNDESSINYEPSA